MTDILIIIILVAIGALFISLFTYLWWLSSPEHIGEEGENRVHDILMQLPDEYYVFKDVILKKKIGTTQIDHIVVSKYGVFAIETKNYRGEIYGDDKRRYWTQIIVTDVNYRRKWYKTYTYVTKNRFYNPVKQSLSHMYTIKDYLRDWPHVKVVPIVVFAGGACLKKVETRNCVVYDYELLQTILNYRTIYLNDSSLRDVVNRINSNNVRESVDNKTHLQNLRTAANEVNNKIASGVCPKCGGKLVARNGKYGQFWGCSNYPKCKFTLN